VGESLFLVVGHLCEFCFESSDSIFFGWLFIVELIEVDQVRGGSPCGAVSSVVTCVATLIADDMHEVCLPCARGNISWLGGLSGLSSSKPTSLSSTAPRRCASSIQVNCDRDWNIVVGSWCVRGIVLGTWSGIRLSSSLVIEIVGMEEWLTLLLLTLELPEGSSLEPSWAMSVKKTGKELL
jgi:hypothetical protein